MSSAKCQLDGEIPLGSEIHSWHSPRNLALAALFSGTHTVTLLHAARDLESLGERNRQHAPLMSSGLSARQSLIACGNTPSSDTLSSRIASTPSRRKFMRTVIHVYVWRVSFRLSFLAPVLDISRKTWSFGCYVRINEILTREERDIYNN